MRRTLERILATWPDGVRPKVHFSSPNTGIRTLKRRDRKTGKPVAVNVAPVWTGHADFANPFEFIAFMRLADGLAFDVMLESKVKDLAVLRLRPDMLRYAPEIAARFGLSADMASALEDEDAAFEDEEADGGA